MALCHLKVVLLCSGNGADANSYRPKRDESQWWNRRDALVRCVASFLFGPKGANSHRELILLYDGDHARIHMVLDERQDSTYVFPSENLVIGLWKEAVTKAIQAVAACKDAPVVRRGNLTCWAVLSLKASSTESHPSGLIDSKMIQDWNKRQLLDFLQNQCSMEFLREHGLNSSSNVILRKTNRTALAKVFQIWNKERSPITHSQCRSSANNGNKTGKMEMDAIFQDILSSFSCQKLNANLSLRTTDLIAATLHESSDCELPCFGDISNIEDTNPLNLCLFLGAVRDMAPEEYRVLQRICQGDNRDKCIPLIKVRLGWVPEFTSKILSIVAFHHSQGRLGGAMRKLISSKHPPEDRRKRKKAISDANACHTQQSAATQPPQLYILCLAPLNSDQIVLDLNRRNRTLWCLVRILVCSLWRSRLARTSSLHNATIPLENTLTLIFLDGNYLTLQQNEWVTALAEQHQAAPSEYQVLKALIDLINTSAKSTTISQRWPGRTKEILQDSVKKCSTDDGNPRCIISIERSGLTDLAEQFYQMSRSASNNESCHRKELWAFLPLPLDGNDMKTSQEAAEVHTSFLHTLNGDPSWSVTRQCLVDANAESQCIDWEASSITTLQHFIYQDRLCNDIVNANKLSKTMFMSTTIADAIEAESKKRKKDKRKKKKRKKSV